MRGGKRPNVPAGALISLGTKVKKPLLSTSSSSQINAAKKAKSDFIEVEPSELVSRTEAALSSGNLQLAESLVLSALNQLRTTGGPTSSAAAALAIGGPGFRSSSSGSSSGSRLLPGFSLGLLTLAQAHPSLFSRVAILDQLISLLSLSPRELGISLPPAAVATICARARGLHVLVANLIYFAFASSSKWPSHLVKLYLEDSLMDRIWVDQDECRAFVLNLETAFPKVYGDPRGLFSVLCSSSGSLPSTTQSSGATSSSNAVHVALGLVTGLSSTSSDITDYTVKDDIADAVATTLKSASSSVAKVVHGGDPTQLVSPRFESSRQAVEVMIVNTLRDALGRRGGSGGVGGGSSGTTVASGITSSAGSAQSNSNSANSSAMSSTAGSNQTMGSSVGSIEVTQLRGLIRTVAMACGLPEIRGLVATRLEPWITNPKIQIYAIGLLAVLASNCRSGGLSPHDLDLMISIIYRIRYKLLKPNIQAAFFECLSHLIKANPMNLYCMIHLCAMPELRPPLTSDLVDAKMSTGQFLTQTVLKVAETVRSMSGEGNEDRAGKGVHSQHQLNAARMEAVAAGASSAATTRGSSSVYFILPFLFQRFGAQWVRIMGNLLHERLLMAASTSNFGPLSNASTLTLSQIVDEVNAALIPVYTFLRELARSSRPNVIDSGMHGTNQGSSGTSMAVTSGNQPQLVQQAYLPCAELAGVLLQDRIYRLNTTASAAANATISALSTSEEHRTPAEQPVVMGRIQFYLNGLVALVCAMQMLSASRPHLGGTSASRRTTAHGDAMKAHQTAIRQIRLAVVRWAKTILPPLVNAAMQSTGSVSPHNNTLLTCIDGLKPSLLIRRAFMLDSTVPLHRTESISYQLQPFYPIKEIWANDQENNALIRLVTDTVLPEKLAHQLLILGLEPSRQLFNPLDALDMVCEMIGRAALLARDSGLEPLNVSKPEQLVDLLYACCTYVPDQQLPSDITELAYASAYWRVSITAVILAAHCLQTCGSHLWTHYPTVRHLIEMVMTSNFTGNGEAADLDASMLEAERLNAQIELQLILRLESFLLNATADTASTPVATVTPETSKLIGRLVRNNPRGPCRLPPVDKLQNLRLLAEELALGRRLWRSRDPDFLLELLRSQAGHTNVQPWLVRLVESSGTDFEFLPIQCLCEYLLRDTMARCRQSYVNVLPLSGREWNARSELVTSRRASAWTDATSKDVRSDSSASKSQLRAHLVAKLRDSLRTFSSGTTSDALIHSFFVRLNDRHSWIRQAVRQCLFILTEPETSTAVRSQESILDWLNVLHTLRQLPALRSEPKVSSMTTPGDGNMEPLQHLLSAVLDSLMVETEMDILTAGLIFLSHVTRSSDFVSWRPVIASLTRFILSRPNILSVLLHRSSRSQSVSEQTELALDTSYLALEALAEMYVRYVEYNCTAAGAIPVDEHKSVFVTWSGDRECPLELEFIQAQLILLTHIHDGLPDRPPSFVVDVLDAFHDIDSEPSERSWWVRLRDTWFVPETDAQFCLPQLTPFATQLSHFPGADVFHRYQLSFDELTDVNRSPRPCLSSDLRCGLIRSNQTPLVYGALWRINPTELVDVLKKSPAYLLTTETARVLLNCWNVMKNQLPAEQQKLLGVTVSHLQSKCDDNKSIHGLMQQDKVQSLSHHDLDDSQPVPMDVSVSDEHIEVFEDKSGSVWSYLVSTLSPLPSSKRSSIVCKTLRELASDETKRHTWLEHLVDELSAITPTGDNKRSPLLSPKGHSRVRSGRSTHASAFRRIASSDPALCRILRPLVLMCLSTTSPLSVELKSHLGTLAKHSEPSLDVDCMLSNLFPSSDHIRNSSTTDVRSTSLKSPELPSMEIDDNSSSATFVDQVGQFGLVELIQRLPSSTSDTTAHHQLDADEARLLRAVQYTVFRRTAVDAEVSTSSVQFQNTVIGPDVDRVYLLRCLLQQANPSFLWHLLRSLLQTTDVENVDSTQLLDFFMAVLTLPRFTYPVPRSEPRDRPDPTAALSELHQLSVTEAIHLTLHILSEARQAALQSATDVVRHIDAMLIRRTALLNMTVIQHPGCCVRYAELLSGCLGFDEAKTFYCEPWWISTGNINEARLRAQSSDDMWNVVALRFLTHVYQRWPGVIGLIKSPMVKAWIAYPHRFRFLVGRIPRLKAIVEKSEVPLSFVEHIPLPEVDRLGPLLLVSLTSSNAVLAESVQLACKALVVHHPRAALRLLPVLAALSDGRLGLSWTQFSSRRYHLLFGDLLHLLELLSTFKVDNQGEEQEKPFVDLDFETNMSDSALLSEEATYYRTSIERLLTNMIRMLAQFRQQAKKLGGFTTRLARLLESYGSRESGRQSLLTVCKTVPEELDQVITSFDEFASLLVSANGSTEETKSDSASTGDFPFPSLSPAVHGSRPSRRWTVAVQPFRQRLQLANSAQAILELLEDLNETSKRRVDVLLHFKVDLERLIGHSTESVCALSLQLLLRLLHQYPRLAPGVIETTVLPCLSPKLSDHGSIPIAVLESLPTLCLLAPTLAPRLLHACAENVLFGVPTTSSYVLLSAVEESVRRLTLDGLDAACVEHASSALVSRTNLIRGGPSA